MLTSLASAGWVGAPLLLIFLLRRQLSMMAMKLVFVIFRVPTDDQVKWVLKEAKRNDKMALARGFWNRASQWTSKASPTPRRIPATRRTAPAPMAELPGDAQKPRVPAA